MFQSYRNTSKYFLRDNYVTIAMVIFSLLKITCYWHGWRYHVYTQKLTWYFTCVYINKKNLTFYCITFLDGIPVTQLSRMIQRLWESVMLILAWEDYAQIVSLSNIESESLPRTYVCTLMFVFLLYFCRAEEAEQCFNFTQRILSRYLQEISWNLI